METPPNNGLHRPNFMQFRRGDGEEQSYKNDLTSKFGSRYHFYKKETVPVMNEQQNIKKIMDELKKKQFNHLENTKWMFCNNSELPIHNPYPL